MKRLSRSQKILLVTAVIVIIGMIPAMVLWLRTVTFNSMKIVAYAEWKYKKDFELIDEFTYTSYTDGEPDTQKKLKCPAVVLQDKENEISFIAYAEPLETGEWIYSDNYSQKLLIYCMKQEQIEINNEDECTKADSFYLPCLMLDNTDETAQKLQNMTVRFNELYQYNHDDNYNEKFQVEGSVFLYSVEAGNINDRWLDETSPFCYDTPLEKYKAFLDKLEEEKQNGLH